MDINRARTYARFVGFIALVAAGASFLFLEKSLKKIEKRSIGYDPRDVVYTRDPEEAARKLLGSDGYVAGAEDLDLDGRPEIAVAARANSTRDGETWVSRVVILSARDSFYAVLFDTTRTIDVPRIGAKVTYWRVAALTPSRIEIDGLDSAGRPLHQFVEAHWKPLTQTYSRRVYNSTGGRLPSRSETNGDRSPGAASRRRADANPPREAAAAPSGDPTPTPDIGVPDDFFESEFEEQTDPGATGQNTPPPATP